MSLKQHLAGHNRKTTAGSLDFQCEHLQCGKRFKDIHLLELHQNIHRNNLQKCYFCPWAGTQGHAISTHHDRHILHQRFQCSDCGKKFYRKENRDLHFEAKHEKIAKKYSCKLCSFQTHSKILLKTHRQRKHWFK